VTIWTSIEPSVGVLCACLPTLRPLLNKTWLEVKNLRSIVSSFANQTRQDTVIQLESGNKRTEEPNLSRRTGWIDDSFDLLPSQGISRETAITGSAGGPDPERNDMLLTNINVQHDLQIERAPR